MCLCPNTGITPLAEDCLVVELPRSLGPVHGFYVLQSMHSGPIPCGQLLWWRLHPCPPHWPCMAQPYAQEAWKELNQPKLNTESLVTAFPFSTCFSHLGLVFIFLADPPPPPPRRRSALQPSPRPPACAPRSARPTATQPPWTRPCCRKRPRGAGKPRQSEPRLTTTSTPQSCPAAPTSSSRLRPSKPWSRGLCPPPELAPLITMAEDRGKASSTTTLWTSSTQPRAPSSTVEKRVRVNASPCRSRSSEHSVRAPRQQPASQM